MQWACSENSQYWRKSAADWASSELISYKPIIKMVIIYYKFALYTGIGCL